jgi:hypothetical protein
MKVLELVFLGDYELRAAKLPFSKQLRLAIFTSSERYSQY